MKRQSICLLLVILVSVINCGDLKNFCFPNNACSKYISYFNIAISKNCYCVATAGHDPDVVAESLIGESEFHQVRTQDGYLIGVFRLPHPNPRGVVILHHPMGVSSRVWLMSGRTSTAYAIWLRGYDVWMPNNRGTDYSRTHLNKTLSHAHYWNFSFHEIGLYDHRPVIDYVYERTQRKAFFVTHSLSTTTILLYSLFYPQEAIDKLEVIFAMAPIYTFKYMKSPIRLIAPLWKPASVIANGIGLYSVLGLNAWYMRLLQIIWSFIPFKFLLPPISEFIYGYTPHQMAAPMANLGIYSGFSTFSLKTGYHLAQIVNSGEFSQYDYGKKKNMAVYGSVKPPLYDLSKIQVPMQLMYSTDDIFSAAEDNRNLYKKLGNGTKIYGAYEFSGLNHVDYHVGKDRFNLIYDRIINKMDDILLQKI